MAQVAADEGAPFVDGPALAAAEGATLGWWLDQVHPSAVGHRALGHALATKLAAAAPTGD
jgi:lysophospholipase L1-like esterase